MVKVPESLSSWNYIYFYRASRQENSDGTRGGTQTMRRSFAEHCVRDATVEIPWAGDVHQAARRVPGARLVLQMSDLQVDPYLAVFIDPEGGHCDADHSRIDAKFEIRAVAKSLFGLSSRSLRLIRSIEINLSDIVGSLSKRTRRPFMLQQRPNEWTHSSSVMYAVGIKRDMFL